MAPVKWSLLIEGYSRHLKQSVKKVKAIDQHNCVSVALLIQSRNEIVPLFTQIAVDKLLLYLPSIG